MARTKAQKLVFNKRKIEGMKDIQFCQECFCIIGREGRQGRKKKLPSLCPKCNEKKKNKKQRTKEQDKEYNLAIRKQRGL